MNCETCSELLLVEDLRLRDHPDAREHLAGCMSCTEIAHLLASGESALSVELDSMRPHRQPSEVATVAWSRSRAQVKRRRVLAIAGAAVIALLALTVRPALFELQRLTAPQPPAITRTFPTTCLSGDQAATLLRPYLPVPQNPRWQAEAFDVWSNGDQIRAVTVRAPQELIDRIPELLTQFESGPVAACRP